MSEVTTQGLLTAEHRGLRELYAAAKTLERHWGRLARMISPPAQPELLRDGATAARELLAELETRTAEYDLFGTPAAQGVGAQIAGARGLSDRLLERNQALRGALLDLRHTALLLHYLATLARTRGDDGLAVWHAAWEERLRAFEDRGLEAVAAMAADPDGAIAPADDGTIGRMGQKLNHTLGSLGEAIDNRFGHR
jgi:hypothetical protein